VTISEVIGKGKPANDAPKPPRKTNGNGSNNTDHFEQCRKYVSKMPGAISGSGGHPATIDVVRVATGFALDESQCLDILYEFNERCQPPWSKKELAHKASYLNNFRKYAPGYILDRRQSWDSQRSAARVAWPSDDNTPEPQDPGGPPMFGENEQPDNIKDEEKEQRSPRGVSESIDDAIALVSRRQSHEDEPVPVPFYDYAKALDGGLWSGVEVLISTTGGLKTQLAVQKLWHVAKQGIPCLYVTLELTVIEATIRLLAQVAGVSWSTAMKGQLSPDAFARFQAAGVELATLPIEIKRGAPYRFSSDDLTAVVTDFRIAHPQGRAYAVVDFAQLLKCSQQNAEARERVGQVLYSMQILAKEKNVVITAISSTARANNIGLADIKKFADLRFEDGKKIVGNPMALLSLGKEAGEVELAAEYQLVMAKWPEKTVEGAEIIIGAIAKYRLNRCKWFAMAVDHGRLLEYPCSSWEDLPEVVPDKGAIREQVTPDEYERRICEFVRLNPGAVRNKTGFRGQVEGKVLLVDAAAERLIAREIIVRGPKGGFVLPEREQS